MTPKTFIIATAVALGVAAAILFMTPVSATTAGGRDVSCGTVWSPDTDKAKWADFGESMDNAFAHNFRTDTSYTGFQQVCSDARDARGTWGYVLAGLCIVGLVGGATVRRSVVTGQQTPPAQTSTP